MLAIDLLSHPIVNIGKRKKNTGIWRDFGCYQYGICLYETSNY